MIFRRLFLIGLALFYVMPVHVSLATTITFGTGVNQFTMDFVTIGRPGNFADTTGVPNPAGAVGYVYQMGMYEVSENLITKFNASQSFQITKDTRGPDKPATSVSWNEAARFVNWLNSSTGGFVAYKFTTSGINDNIALWTPADTLDFNPANPFRSLRANYVLPSFDEWYKASYFDPVTGLYSDFPNGLNTPPIAVASGTTAGTAVYRQANGSPPANVNLAGGLSPFGVMGLGGNVYEWQETESDLLNDNPSSGRGVRGGRYDSDSVKLSSLSLFTQLPAFESFDNGFRVASLSIPAAVPEPSSMAIWGFGTCFMAVGIRGRRH